MAKTLKYTGDQIESRLGGNFGNDNVNCNYTVAKWLQSLSTSNLGSAPARYPVFDSEGWIYFRTPGQMKADLGLPFYGTSDTAAATQEKIVTCADFALKEGANTITIKSADKVGKSTTVTRTVTLDTSVPVIESVTITPNPANTGQTMQIKVVVS